LRSTGDVQSLSKATCQRRFDEEAFASGPFEEAAQAEMASNEAARVGKKTSQQDSSQALTRERRVWRQDIMINEFRRNVSWLLRRIAGPRTYWRRHHTRTLLLKTQKSHRKRMALMRWHGQLDNCSILFAMTEYQVPEQPIP